MSARQQMREHHLKSVTQLDLLRVAASDLQRPLLHVVGTASMLREGVFDASELDEQYRRLEISAQQMQRMIEAILLANQVQTQQVQLAFEPMNASAVVHKVVQSFQPLARRYSVALRPQMSQSLQLISGNEVALEHGLSSLLDVAIRSSSAAHIDVLVHNQDNEVMVTLRDDSEKLSAGSLSSILKRFTSTAQPVKQLPSGAGLSVYIATVLLEHMNGSVHFHAEHGKRHISLNIPLSKQMSLSL